ncbi:HvfC family RiPP maturation protein [Shewanella metallivivens]|uniref:DNA-binding domain-containing protein n=1 Tax=Shewanella metallivivens TaxID=2872342 RepID=A0ABT5TGN4_9GAMM|nr:putative DNA-binding domain-containing protein [Shewanella metallivivens]MDD8057773.1 putative DNA-binding domain-containing protein [Shewanella metallivivens]
MRFIEVQQQFMDYIRDPSLPMPEGIEPRRMKVYRDLFFNNISGFVASAFPVLKSLYQDDTWQALVQQLFAKHDCKTPIFVEIAGEFLTFLQHEYQVTEDDPVFMLQLAHYEWLELCAAVAPDIAPSQRLNADDVEQFNLCLSPSAKVAQYAFDVQHISVDYQPIEPTEQANFFCVYRDSNDEVAFLQLTPLSAQVLAYIEQTSQVQQVNLDAIVEWLADLYPQMSADSLLSGCVPLLQQLALKGIIVAATDA